MDVLLFTFYFLPLFVCFYKLCILFFFLFINYSVWNNREPPSSSFIEQHLSVCRGNITPMNPNHNHPAAHLHHSGYSTATGTGTGAMEMYAPSHHSHNHPSRHHSFGMNMNVNPGSGVAVSMHHHPYPPQATSMGYMDIPPHHTHAHIAQVQAKQQVQHHQPLIEFVMPQNTVPAHLALVHADDALLLTQYFYYLILQLQLCHFVETDRKTRGGKRDNIAVGFGGLQCRHCYSRADPRKFFWSDVDRLANSFAEIPNHVLKCRECPEDIKRNLRHLKTLHAEQMAKLPRGSQKVFFRRMWRRIHKEEHEQQQSTPNSSGEVDAAQHQSSNESLKDNSAETKKTSISPTSSTSPNPATVAVSNTPSTKVGKKRILLAIDDDRDWLSDMDCFVRRNLEVFTVSATDLVTANEDLRTPVTLGQVGIRCMHCANTDAEARGTAVYYPTSIDHVYESVRNFQRYHFELCVNIPPEVQTQLAGLSQCTSLSSVLRRYYVLAAKALGMVNAPYGVCMQIDSASDAETLVVANRSGVMVSSDSQLASMKRPLDDADKEEKENSPILSPVLIHRKMKMSSITSPIKKIKQDTEQIKSNIKSQESNDSSMHDLPISIKKPDP